MTPPSTARTFAAAGLALAFLLAGCPLPQPVPAFEGAVSVTPPRILTDTVRPQDSVVRVGTTCTADDFLAFGGDIDDPDLDDAVEARWFVDYSPGSAGVQKTDFPPASGDGEVTRRTLSEFRFFPALPPGSGTRVVEVVVSNGFFPINGDPPGSPQPNRTAQPGFETQVFRWVVVYEPGGRCQ